MKRLLFALIALAPITTADLTMIRLNERCDTLCPIIGKGDKGRGRRDGKCECINIVDPGLYTDKRIPVPRRYQPRPRAEYSAYGDD